MSCSASRLGGLSEVEQVGEVLDDAVHSSFADADEAGDLGEAYLGVLGNADQDVGVVRQGRPRRDLRSC